MRPEEQVRLRVIEWLREECGIPVHRISSELLVKPRLKSSNAHKRADILAYCSDLKPFLLVECKAEDVKLNDNTALQAATYNEDIRAPFVMLTNGKEDYCFEVVAGSSIRRVSPRQFTTETPDKPAVKPRRDLEYWHKRGFAGSADTGIARLPEALGYLFGDKRVRCRYIHVGGVRPYPEFSHYYAIRGDWAISMLSTTGGDTWMTALNDPPEGENRMFCYPLSPGIELPPAWLPSALAFSLEDAPADPFPELLARPDEHLLSRLIARLEELKHSGGLVN